MDAFERMAAKYGDSSNGTNEKSQEKKNEEFRERRAQMMEDMKQMSREKRDASELAQIDVSLLDDSQFNSIRSVDNTRVRAIADSIKKFGLLNPLLVFKSSDNRYTIYGGHVRKAAWLHLIDSDPSWPTKIPCRILPAPKGENESDLARSEMEIQSQAEIHRFTKKDVEIEITRANELWDKYTSDEEKQLLREEFLNEFKKRNEDNPAYQNDPKEYIRQYFRPRYEYIRLITGIEANSDSSIQRALRTKEENEEHTNSAVHVVAKRTRNNRISFKKLEKKLTPYRDYLSIYSSQSDADPFVKAKTKKIIDLIDDIQRFISEQENPEGKEE